MKEICNCACKALDRFSSLTDLEPTKMHESFMASFMFDRLGEKWSLAPELMVSTIWEWMHYDATPTPPLPRRANPQQRIDLTLFTPQDAPKEDQSLWCFIELKRRDLVSGDYEKLKKLLRFLKCPFAAACGVVDVEKYHDWLLVELAKQERKGERFIVSAQLEIQSQHFAVFAHLFPVIPRQKRRAREGAAA